METLGRCWPAGCRILVRCGTARAVRAAFLLPLLLAAGCAQKVFTDRWDGAGPVDLRDVPIRNFAQVDKGLFRGAQPDADTFGVLGALGVRTIVNLRLLHDDDPEDLPAGMEVVEIPMEAFLDSDPPTDEDVRRFFEVVLDPARRPVFVHCAQGKDRTGTMCALYRMEVHGWSNEEAFAEMQRLGFHDFYADLERYVLGYRPRGFAAAAPR